MASDESTDEAKERADEEKLRHCVEHLTNGRVTAMERQIRWRPAWFVEVERDGELIPVHIRGDRNSDVVPFPDLRREADVIEILEQHGIPVPHIYGMCEDPPAIVMQTVPGTRDVSTAENDEQRRSVARQYIDALVAMHQLPLEPFVARGIKLPRGAEEIALAGLEAYTPLYRKHKHRPEPLIEFATRWLRSNIPAHRTKPGFIAFDAGQFLFEKGKLTALYDFEFSMIGDPLTDLATMAMRQSIEPMGDEINNLCHYYAQRIGEDLDVKVVHYHIALFSTVACMQFVGAIGNPQPGDPHDVYLEWDLALRRSLILILAECLGVDIDKPESLSSPIGGNAVLLKKLDDAVSQIGAEADAEQARKDAACKLVEYLVLVDQYGDELERLANQEAARILGKTCKDKSQRDEEMEQFVNTAGPEHNAALLRFFANEIERQVLAYGDSAIGGSASHVRLQPIN